MLAIRKLPIAGGFERVANTITIYKTLLWLNLPYLSQQALVETTLASKIGLGKLDRIRCIMYIIDLCLVHYQIELF